MGKRQRRRSKQERSPDSEPAAATEYTDADGNVLALRDSLSAATLQKLGHHEGSAAATAEDVHHRREELLFEGFAVSWTIAGLPLERQSELLGRYRMADRETREWVSRTIHEHLRSRGIDVA